MRKLLPLSMFFALLALSFNSFAGVEKSTTKQAGDEPMFLGKSGSDPVHFIDIRFTRALHALGVDQNGDGLISYDEAAAVTSLDISKENPWKLTPDMICDLTGIEAFVNLESLNIRGNLISKLDVSKLTMLRYLNAELNRLEELDLSNNRYLEFLNCNWNLLKELDVTENPELEQLRVNYNSMTDVDISANRALTHFTSSAAIMGEAKEMAIRSRYNASDFTNLCGVDFSNNGKLEFLHICGQDLSGLDISNNRNIEGMILEGVDGAVCTWDENFKDLDIIVHEVCCTNIFYKDCAEPGLSASANGSGIVQANSNEDGMIFIVPEGTLPVYEEVLDASILTTPVAANSTVDIQVPDGTYWVYAGDNSGNLSEKWEYKSQSLTADEILAESLQVYPNPALDYLTVRFDGNAPATLEVFSVNGQLMMSRTLFDNHTTISLEDIPRGLYMLRLTAEGATVSMKIIKQ